MLVFPVYLLAIFVFLKLLALAAKMVFIRQGLSVLRRMNVQLGLILMMKRVIAKNAPKPV
jgi:hypothetical protein